MDDTRSELSFSNMKSQYSYLSSDSEYSYSSASESDQLLDNTSNDRFSLSTELDLNYGTKFSRLVEFTNKALDKSDRDLRDIELSIKRDPTNSGMICMLYSERSHNQLLSMFSALLDELEKEKGI